MLSPLFLSRTYRHLFAAQVIALLGTGLATVALGLLAYESAGASLSRLAYHLESLVSPALAALLLTLISFHWLFAGTAIGFLASAALVLLVALPSRAATARRGVYDRMTKGIRIHLATPRLRGLLALNVAVAAASAMVIVKTVVIMQAGFGFGQREVADALASFSGGSMLSALLLPGLLERVSDRAAILTGAAVLVIGLGLGATASTFSAILALWSSLGLGYSAAQPRPAGSSAGPPRHPTAPPLFAAQFALSHAAWLVTYPMAGWLGAVVGIPLTFASLAALAALALLAATALWPARDPEAIAHVHADLEPDDPHLAEAERVAEGFWHVHTFVIDRRHRPWPREA